MSCWHRSPLILWMIAVPYPFFHVCHRFRMRASLSPIVPRFGDVKSPGMLLLLRNFSASMRKMRRHLRPHTIFSDGTENRPPLLSSIVVWVSGSYVKSVLRRFAQHRSKSFSGMRKLGISCHKNRHRFVCICLAWSRSGATGLVTPDCCISVCKLWSCFLTLLQFSVISDLFMVNCNRNSLMSLETLLVSPGIAAA